MTQMTLQQRIDASGGPWNMLYHETNAVFEFPMKAEFSNWIDEQRAWRSTAIFQNMSHHMMEATFEGPDIVRLLSDLGINSFAGFGAMQAKQYVVCNYDGYYIGDSILFCEEENKVTIVGKPMVANWVRFHAETGNYDAKCVSVDMPSPNLDDRQRFRFQVQGPNADRILEKVNGGPLPDIPFFKMGRFKVGPHEVTALNHRMSGAPGYEFWGPSEVGQDVMDRIMAAGAKHGLTPIGGRIYPVTAVVSGWIGLAVPAIYTGESMRPYRDWLPAMSLEGFNSVGGSFATGKIEDLYRTPYDLGYGFMVKFDHDFIGREALEHVGKSGRLKKVRLVWDKEDVADILSSGIGPDERYKTLEQPSANYAMAVCDKVMDGSQTVGVSFYPVFSEADRAWISLACIPAEHAVEGHALSVIWGEPDGGSRKLAVERHVQKVVKVTVDPKAVKRG